MRKDSRLDRPGTGLHAPLPALAELWLHQFIRFIVVGEFHLRAVPLELAFEAKGDRSGEQPFRKRPGNTEVRTGAFPAFRGAHPVAMVAGRSREILRGKRVILHSSGGQKPDIGAVSIGGKYALRPHEYGAVVLRVGTGTRGRRWR